MTPARRLALLLCLPAAAASAGACGGLASLVADAGRPPVFVDREMPFEQQSLTLHLGRPGTDGGRPLVVYMTGDGGWFGRSADMFHAIVRLGYPAVGISAREYMRVERRRHAPVSPGDVAAEYQAVAAEAERALALPPSTTVVLAGWSRGASFAVIAAAEPRLRARVRGVVVFALTDRERLNLPIVGEAGDVSWPSAGAGGLDPYQLLPRLAPIRCAVIQAEEDAYVPSGAARRLIGPDGPFLRLFPILGTGHRFGGADRAFVDALTEALAWVAPAPSRLAPARPAA
ncbi:MAG: alpha/beta fold hydrolase [Vicinamibacterales bacterium]